MFKKNTAITGFNVGSFIQVADGAEKTTGTPTAAMVQDGVAAACGNVPAYDATLGAWKVILSAETTNCNVLGLKFSLSGCFPKNFDLSLETKKMADLQDLAAGAQMDLVNAPNATALAAVKTALMLPTGIPKNVALPNLTFPMWDSSNPEQVKSGLTVTGTIRKDSGAFAALAGAITEIGTTGMYKVDITQAEMNADLIELFFEAVGGSDQPVLIKTNA